MEIGELITEFQEAAPLGNAFGHWSDAQQIAKPALRRDSELISQRCRSPFLSGVAGTCARLLLA